MALDKELVDEFFRYCCDVNTIHSIGIDIISEIDFVRLLGLDIAILGDSIIDLFSYYESPILPLLQYDPRFSSDVARQWAAEILVGFVAKMAGGVGNYADSKAPGVRESGNAREAVQGWHVEFAPGASKLDGARIEGVFRTQFPDETAYAVAICNPPSNVDGKLLRNVGSGPKIDHKIARVIRELYPDHKIDPWNDIGPVKKRLCGRVA